jgi:hypothetical protein
MNGGIFMRQTSNASIDYSSATGLTFDTSLIEISSGAARLKNQYGSEVMFFANFSTAGSMDGYYSSVDGVTGTATGSPTVSGGVVSMLGGSILRYISYPVANAQFGNTCTIEFDYTPNYSGVPAAPRCPFFIGDLATGANGVQVTHLDSGFGGALIVGINNGAGTFVSHTALSAWLPTAGQTYKFALVVDTGAGRFRLFIDGVQFATLTFTAFTKTPSITTSFLVGTDLQRAYKADFTIDNFLVSNTAKYSAAYTPTTPPQTKYSILNPSIINSSGISAGALYSLAESAIKPTGTEIKYNVSVAGQAMYPVAGVWGNSDRTYSQAVTASQLNTDFPALDIHAGKTILLEAFLHSPTGDTTPSISLATWGYDLYPSTATLPNVVKLYLRGRDLFGDYASLQGMKLRVSNDKAFFNQGYLQLPFYKEVAFDDLGYLHMELLETATCGEDLDFKIVYNDPNTSTEKTIAYTAFQVPNTPQSDLKDLLVLAP